MREILFRGFSTDSGKWVEGFLVQTQSNTYIIHPGWYNDDLFISLYNIIDKVDPATVGQFTGLTDKNGKKIFEGDILKYQMNIRTAIVGRVAFVSGAFVFESEELERECDIAFASFADDEISFPQHCIEVLGNIHDNPELLNAE